MGWDGRGEGERVKVCFCFFDKIDGGWGMEGMGILGRGGGLRGGTIEGGVGFRWGMSLRGVADDRGKGEEGVFGGGGWDGGCCWLIKIV